jgi:prepilin-type N-terminal cleavage/methylation domain-containing protein
LSHNKKAFTLVEMLVALCVSAIIVAATYASFDLIQKQYKKNMDVAQFHLAGRAIMQVLEREVRMAGYEFRNSTGVMTYGAILAPIVISDSGNQCCDEVTIIYDEVSDTLNAQGAVIGNIVDRVQTRFWTLPIQTNNRGNRFRLFKRRTILGTNNALLATPTVEPREVMADFLEDVQFSFLTNSNIFVGTNGATNIQKIDAMTEQVISAILSTSQASALAFNNTAAVLYAGFNGARDIQIINPATRTITGSIPNTSQASALAFNSAGTFLYAGFNGARDIQIINPATRTITGSITGTSQTSALAFNSAGTLYAGHNGSRNIQVINPVTSLITGSIANTSQTAALAFDSAGTLYAGHNGSRNIQVINTGASTIIGTIANTSQMQALAFDSAGTLYAGHNGSRNIQIINPVNRAIIGNISNTSNRSALAFMTKKMGNGSLVNINISLRSREQYGNIDRQVDKQDYHSGNFNFSITDRFQRDTFSSTVSVRNM